ncbi:glutamate--tRNA ligase, cytoplasmic-like [Quercus robur]|uniref:glutamate--tRNA ligase, cytoplasmic-like n=1 Tax=Quercus robur TaxID=38942 RepID=UPI002163FE1A|nr:glutamate--tRNA ligase, cytoplasmic-like [Quercus robur]
MEIRTLSFPADSLSPLPVIVAAKLADLALPIDTSLPPNSAPTLLFSNGHKLHGTYVLLRYIARVASLPNFYGQNAYESGQIDEWLEYAPVFSLGPAFDKIYVMVVVGAAKLKRKFQLLMTLRYNHFIPKFCFPLAS